MLQTGLPRPIVDRLVSRALEEDLGLAGDITTAATVISTSPITTSIAARAAGTISGHQLASTAFHALDPNVSLSHLSHDGARVEAGTKLIEMTGAPQAILTAERVALNFMIHMSGIATLTARYVDAIEGTNAAICCTRKTLPGLRAIEKYAVKSGGGMNHRFGLDDAVLIKDNHIAAAGGIKQAITAARAHAGHMTRIEVEVDTLDQLAEALNHKVDVIMLDNMNNDDLRKAVALVDGRAVTEASGGVNLDTVRNIAETGVDMISVGALTHSAPALDLGLDFH
ncbi:MAG: carboxylating nicotinate-nucleotide diphosphorylase [Hyphomicrobiaceae bacterium]